MKYYEYYLVLLFETTAPKYSPIQCNLQNFVTFLLNFLLTCVANTFLGPGGMGGLPGPIGPSGDPGRPGIPGEKGETGTCSCSDQLTSFTDRYHKQNQNRQKAAETKSELVYTRWGSSTCGANAALLYSGANISLISLNIRTYL